MIAVLPQIHWISVMPHVPKSELKHDRCSSQYNLFQSTLRTYSTLRDLVKSVLSKDYGAECSDSCEVGETHLVGWMG
jgi:hypothetical protein